VFRSETDIWRLQLDNLDADHGVTSRLISSTRVDDCPTFSPDGNKIAFYSDRSGSGEIWVCDRDGSNAGQLTSLGAGTTETIPPSLAPRWSPDGRKIVFAALIGGGTRYSSLMPMAASPSVLRLNHSPRFPGRIGRQTVDQSTSDLIAMA